MKSRRARSSPSSPPRRWARAPGLACRWSTAWRASRAGREKPDLVVLDFIMPGLSGAEVASRILADLPDQPILFVSGYSETEAVKCTAPDAPLLMKPFRSEALEKAVRAALTHTG